MKPSFAISADGGDITGAVKDRLMELRVNDEAGNQSDTVEIRLDDRGGTLALPRKGTQLSVAIGYEETGLVDKGLYVVDEVEGESAASSLTIKAKAADMRSSLKAAKTRGWDGKTLGDIVNTIAGEHGLQAKVAPALAGMNFEHVDQTNESDMHFLTRLAKQYDAIAKPAGEYLVMVPRGEAKSATGKSLPSVSLTRKDITSYRFTIAERGKYGKVIAHYRDEGKAEDVAVTYGDGEPAYTIRHPYQNFEQAYAAAKAKKEALDRGTATVGVTMPGNADVAAEGKVTLSECRDGVDGTWVVTKATHVITGTGGFSTEFDGETPKS